MLSFEGASKMTLLKFLSGLVWFAGSPSRYVIDRTMDEMIREAMSERKKLVFDYDGLHRVVEPHVYGRKNDKNGMLVYQTEGQSSRGELGWKRMYMEKMTNMKVLDETFPGRREVTGMHSVWDLFYYIVD